MDMESLLMEMVRDSARRDRHVLDPHGHNRHDVLDERRVAYTDRRRMPRQPGLRREKISGGRRSILTVADTRRPGVLRTLRRIVGL